MTGAQHPVVDRDLEAQLLEAALLSGAHVLLEGPPGTGKSTLLRQVASGRHVPFVLVEGNAELTPARLVGHFDPALVLSKGYRPDIFVDGPLLEAMRSGGLLYVEELNRVPEETINVLLTVMSEAEITVPRLGRVPAAPGFGLVAAMNPYDAVGTARISSALYDRTCRIAMGYQSEAAERRILAMRTDCRDEPWRDRMVELVRSTRDHPDVRIGSSIRGGIDAVGLAGELARLRGVPLTDWTVGLQSAMAALTGRIRLQESCPRTPEDVVAELYEKAFGPRPDPENESGDAPPGEA
ncbi:AAA family ATPase [Nocardioides sp.]|uniref:AAA family ATPase n=1 Tax=Nocardioides sp. TaxID=35761 RepID=UPI003D0B498C